jgi:RNA polymerase sigma-70 factor (ECF subfamily)
LDRHSGQAFNGSVVKDTSDSELMRQVRDGRTGALATLFERHHARLYRFCYRMTGQRASAEDLVQDVFMKMLKYKHTFHAGSEFVPWMFGIGRNACLAHLRRGSAAPGSFDETTYADTAAAEHDEGDAEQAELVRRALLRLPPDRREVLVLSRFEFKTYVEIARALDCSVGAVKVRAHRAMKQLRDIYLELTNEDAL